MTVTIVDFPSQGTIGTNLKPKRMDIEIYQGDSFDVAFVCKDGAGAAVNLTGVTAVAKFVGINGTAQPSTQPTVTVTTATGNVRVTMLDTSSLAVPGEYAWDVQLVEGTRKRTYLGGKLTITKDLTP